jgi:hypothetical protein
VGCRNSCPPVPPAGLPLPRFSLSCRDPSPMCATSNPSSGSGSRRNTHPDLSRVPITPFPHTTYSIPLYASIPDCLLCPQQDLNSALNSVSFPATVIILEFLPRVIPSHPSLSIPLIVLWVLFLGSPLNGGREGEEGAAPHPRLPFPHAPFPPPPPPRA